MPKDGWITPADGIYAKPNGNGWMATVIYDDESGRSGDTIIWAYGDTEIDAVEKVAAQMKNAERMKRTRN
jgi:hypothetical protein